MALFFLDCNRGLVLQLLLNGQVTTFHLTHECQRIIHCHFMCGLQVMLLESCLGSSEPSHRLCEQLSKQGAVLGKNKAVYAKSTI